MRLSSGSRASVLQEAIAGNGILDGIYDYTIASNNLDVSSNAKRLAEDNL